MPDMKKDKLGKVLGFRRSRFVKWFVTTEPNLPMRNMSGLPDVKSKLALGCEIGPASHRIRVSASALVGKDLGVGVQYTAWCPFALDRLFF